MWNRVKAIGPVVIVFGLLTTAVVLAVKSMNSKIYFETTEYVVPLSLQGDEVTVVFKCINNSPSDYTFRSIVHGCSCTAATPSSRTIKQDHTATITVVWKIGASRGAAATDTMITLYNNDTEEVTEHVLQIRSEVDPDLRVTPERIALSSTSTSAKVRVEPGRRVGVTVTRVYCNHDALAAVFDPSDLTIAVTLDRSKLGRSSRNLPALLIETTSQHEPTITVPVMIDNSGVGD